MTNCIKHLSEFEFSECEIQHAKQGNGLLSMEIELSLRCNFRCPYCYVPSKSDLEEELSVGEIKNVILQAKTLGAKKIILLGGEPSIYPHISEIIQFLSKNDLSVEIFTNGSKITDAFAKKLFENQVRVVMKMNTFDENLQDLLSGRKGAYQIIHQALDILRHAGYPSEASTLAVSTIICRQNIDELPKMWQWLRDQDIIPYFEILTPQENAKQNTWLGVSPKELKTFFYTIAAIDAEKYNRNWEPQPPLLGSRCMRHQFSCLVTSKGNVNPCVGITKSMGNVRKQTLKYILANSKMLKDLKDYRNTIKGNCHDCAKSEDCYGCRGTAFQLTGDYLASDPMCWNNDKSTDEKIPKIE